jgi:uncharacterized membrane protein YagU involved in acid resistance
MRPIDIVIGLIAGLIATQVTNFAQGPLQRTTPDAVKQQEQRNHLGDTTSLVAVRRVADYFGASPSQRQMTWLARAIHFGVGMAWGPVYGLLRGYGGLGPLGAGLITGTTMSLTLDEGVVPALGLSAANQDYPLFTHIRGFLAHLVYGAIAALVTERLSSVTRRSSQGNLGSRAT